MVWQQRHQQLYHRLKISWRRKQQNTIFYFYPYPIEHSKANKSIDLAMQIFTSIRTFYFFSKIANGPHWDWTILWGKLFNWPISEHSSVLFVLFIYFVFFSFFCKCQDVKRKSNVYETGFEMLVISFSIDEKSTTSDNCRFNQCNMNTVWVAGS